MWNKGAFGALECPQVTPLLLYCVFPEQFIILTSVLLWPQTHLFLQPPAPHRPSECRGGGLGNVGRCFHFTDDQHQCRRG